MVLGAKEPVKDKVDLYVAYETIVRKECDLYKEMTEFSAFYQPPTEEVGLRAGIHVY